MRADPDFGDAIATIGGVAVELKAAILERLSTPVVVIGLDGTMLYANESALAVYGRDAAALVGASASAVGQVEVDPSVPDAVMRALRAGEAWQGDFDIRRPDGTLVSLRATNSGFYRDDELAGVVSVMTDVTEHRRSIERLADETRALRFVLEATTVLASSLDFRECLQQLAELAVPTLGDLCVIDVTQDGEVVRLGAASADPAARELVTELVERYPPAYRSTRPHPVLSSLAANESYISPPLTDEFLRVTAHDDRHYEILKLLGVSGFMCASLIARGRTLGMLTLVSAGTGREFGRDDLQLAQDLAHRAALVVDNARLFSDQSRVARSLQSALLPPTLPAIPSMEVAARYRAAGEGNEVGGDFYDVFALGRGAWAAAVGDVCGRGPDAAAVTGMVRHALHASAQTTHDPAAMLQTANVLLRAEGPQLADRFCSACCVVLRPGVAGAPVRLTFASAGHPPPFLLRADGTLAEWDAGGLLLGIEDAAKPARRRDALGPGDVLILYTDGLTEARNEAGAFFGQDGVRRALAFGAGLSANVVASKLIDAVEAFTSGSLQDDLALLVIRVP